MPDVTYEIVQHDGDWAYKVHGVFSEAFPTNAEALAAAQAAASKHPNVDELFEQSSNLGFRK
jgi:hypothetical protein